MSETQEIEAYLLRQMNENYTSAQKNIRLRATLANIRDNWDCDEDAHVHGTTCRCCLADAVLKETT